MKHYLKFFQDVVENHWDSPALTDFDGVVDLSYGRVAEEIARLHLIMDAAGIKKGDKVALCSKNCAHWAVSYMAIATYGAVVVSILPDFAPDSVQSLVNHSDSTFLFVGENVWKNLDKKAMPELKGIICVHNYNLLYAKDKNLQKAYDGWDEAFKAKYPNGFSKADVNYVTDNMDDVAMINYTSGTTSNPKGVVLTNKNLSNNVQFGQDRIPNQPGWNMVSMLPMAHMFGLAFEFLYQMAGGCHIFFLSKNPSPQVLMKAFAEAHPYMILTVPLVIEKIFQKSVFPIIKKPLMRVLWYTPGLKNVVRGKVKEKLMQTFGGKLRYLIIGGAAFNKEVEKCLKELNFCYTVGYGMTECAPLIGYEDWHRFKFGSCGKIVDRMQIKVDSPDPKKVVGELMVKGDGVMQGYYKNPEATASIFSDGWMRTGDLGIVDAEGNIFIRGRNKSLILGPSGQNIYPEEIEGKLNNVPGVAESVVVDRDGKLVGLVYPDQDFIKPLLEQGKTKDELANDIKERVNKVLAAFCRLNKVEFVDKEFEKTPKRSIKRFLYS